MMLLNFQDTAAEIPFTVSEAHEIVFGTVSDFFYEASYGKTWLAGDTNTKLLAVTEEKNALDSRLQSLSSTLETELEKNMAMVLSLAKLQTELDVKNALLEKLSIR